MPAFPARPALLPLRLMVLGALLAWLVLSGAGLGAADMGRVLAWLPLTLPGGAIAGQDLVWRALRSALVLGSALGIAHLASLAVAILADRTGAAGRGVASWAMAAIAFAPIAALAWAFIGWWIGWQHGSIETLLGYRPPPGKETTDLALARLVWRWAAPCLLISVPLAAWLAMRRIRDLSGAHRQAATAPLRARGLPPSWQFYHHLLPRLWPAWRRGLELAAVFGLALMMVVEEALHFPGIGRQLLDGAAAGNAVETAQAVNALFWLAALGTALMGFIERRDPWRADAGAEPALPQAASGGWAGRLAPLLLAGVAAAGVWRLRGQGNPGLLWLEGQLGGLHDAVWHDAGAVGKALGIAAALGIAGFIVRASLLGRLLRGLRMLETCAWIPFLAAWPALAGTWKQTWGLPEALWLAIAGAPWIAVRLDAVWRAGLAAPHLEAAQALGMRPLRRFIMHLLPGIIRPVLAVLAELLPLFWASHAWMTALSPASTGGGAPESLGAALAAQREHLLTQPQALLPAALWIMLCGLCCLLPARILTPTARSQPPAPLPHGY